MTPWKKIYKTSLNRKIRCAKAKYYVDIFEKNKSNILHTWVTMIEIHMYWENFKINIEFPDYLTLDRKMMSEPQLIAICFNRFFSSVEHTFSEKISYNTLSSYTWITYLWIVFRTIPKVTMGGRLQHQICYLALPIQAVTGLWQIVPCQADYLCLLCDRQCSHE